MENLLSTAEFYGKLANVDFSLPGPRLKVFSVDFNPGEFERLVNTSYLLTPVENSDGVVSHVRETPGSHKLDHSRSSNYFLLHTDGNYLKKVPEMVILHCAHPGNSDTPTILADTKEIIDALRDLGKLDEAKEYQFVFKNKNNIEFRRPLIEQRSSNGELLMNIAIESPQCYLEPLPRTNKTETEAAQFYDLINTLAKEKLDYIVHHWKKNDLIVFDNLRLIHGRGLKNDNLNLDISDNERHLHRIWLNRQDIVFCLIKPDAYNNKEEIINLIKDTGLDVIHNFSIFTPESLIRALYNEVSIEILNATLNHYLSGPSEILLVRGEQAIDKIVTISGLETDPALCIPSTIRFRHGDHSPEDLGNGLKYYRNAIHRPKNQDEAKRDFNLFNELINKKIP
ncbi:MAG: TauD/TfdA family dioxygenase [bacterium]